MPTHKVEGLLNAASNGNLSVVMEILKSQQCGVNDKHEGQTALHVACQNGHLDVIKYLLGQGANLEVEVSGACVYEYTPHTHTHAHTHTHTHTLMLFPPQDSLGAYPVHYAAIGAEPDVVKLLAQEGADLNVRNRRQQTPLHVATVKGHMTVIRTLLSLHSHASLQVRPNDPHCVVG